MNGGMNGGWGISTRADPIDPKAVKYGAEQADFRRLRPLDEVRFLVSRPWAAIRWPFRMLGGLFGRGASEGDES